MASGINTDTAIKGSKKEAIPITKPKENKRNHMAKNLSSQQRDMMLLDIARDKLYIKNKVHGTMNKQMKQAERHSVAVVESMNNVSSGIKDGLAMLANAILNIHPQQMILTEQWGNTQHYCNQSHQMSIVSPSRSPFNPSTH